MSAAQGSPDEPYVLTGAFLSMLTYGIELAVFFMCMRALRKVTTPDRGFPKPFLIAYSTFLLLLASVYTAFFTRNIIVSFSLHRNESGGPMAYMVATYSSKKGLVGKITAMMTGYTANALLLYRCIVIYRAALRNVAWTLILPGALFVGEIVAGIILIVELVFGRGSTLFKSVTYGLAYFSFSAATNISITLAIATPLLLRRRKMMKEFGDSYARHTKPYIAITTILIESSALVAVVTTLWIAFYGSKSPGAHLFVSITVQVQVIGPLLVIHRVSTRERWSEPLTHWDSQSTDESPQSYFIECIPLPEHPATLRP